MNTITLKDVPPVLHRELKSRAKAHGRSLNKEILVLLQQSVHPQPANTELLLSRARAVRESSGVYLTHHDLSAFKNEGRR